MDKEYFTSNINITAWLCSKGLSYNRMEKKRDGTIVFFFNDTETIRKEIDKYVKNTELQSFLLQQKRMKNEIVHQIKTQ